MPSGSAVAACPDCGSPEIVCESWTSSADCTGYSENEERGRCVNCGYRGDVEEFAGGESMETEVQTTPTEEARVLLFNIQEHEQQKAQLITRLQEQRQQIDQALIDLGAKRKRTRKAAPAKRGRPAGSKNKPVRLFTETEYPVEMLGPTTAREAGF